MSTGEAAESTTSQAQQEPEIPEQLKARVVRYTKPERTRNRQVIGFGRTDSMMVFMQVHNKTGESRLHAHPNTDSFWWVVRGRVNFYTTDHKLMAELGPDEGVLLPRDVPYYFNAQGEEDLEILQFESFLRQGERLQSVFLEEKPEEYQYDISQTGEYVS